MIGLGSQYLTAAGFGRYKITAASLGNLFYRISWLKAATQQAILGAFGDDGWAVINATNAYLNGIAASDRDKATALAGFINTWVPIDVYTIYSFVPTLGKMRLLYFNAAGYIDTGYKAKSLHTKYDVGFIKKANNGAWRPIINNENDTRFGIVCCSSSANNQGMSWVGNPTTMQTMTYDCYIDTFYEVILDKTGLEVNGTKYPFAATPPESEGQYNACINARYTSANATSPERSNMKLRHLRIYEDEVLQRFFIPYIENNKGVLLDVVSGTIFRNKESNTLTVSLEDISYTPSTP